MKGFCDMKEITQIKGDFFGKDIITLDQFSSSDIQFLFHHVGQYQEIADTNTLSKTLAGYIITLLFYEPSSRTFGSFCSAAQRLGAGIIPVQNPQAVSSVSKGESLEDTIRTFASYSDAIVIRSKEAGTAQKAADATYIPVLNAGDGGASNPTQGLLDLYTIYQSVKRLDNLTVVATGDILHSRTIHSLIQGLSLFAKNTIYLLSPKELRLSKEDYKKFSGNGIVIKEIFDADQIPTHAHVWYWNRIQKERFATQKEAEKYTNRFVLTKELLHKYGNKNLMIMDPLPRVGEIDEAVDQDPRAYYFKQMRNGLYVRMTLFSLILKRL